MPSYIELDKEYLELKYFLMRTPTYEDETIAQKKESVFDKIFEEYYDRLPEEERFIIDVLQAYDDFGWWNDDSNLGMILQEYFDHILLKSKYEVNDILIIKLFLVRLVHQDTIINEIEVNTFLVIADKILQQVEMFDIEYSFLIRDSLLLLLGIFEKIANYSQFEDILYKLNEITSKSYDYQKKPIIRLWEWRYALFVKKDYPVAENYFQEAKIFARMIDNSHLIEQLEKQWQYDLQDFFKNKH